MILKRYGLYLFLVMLLASSCGPSARYTTQVVKPKYHHRWFDRKKDKRVKRTKTIKVRS